MDHPFIFGANSGSGGGGGSCGSIVLSAYSDAGHTTPITSATYGEKVYLKVVPSDITPTLITFSFKGNTEKVVTQASGEYTWTVDVTGTIAITASATDGSEGTAILSTFTFTVPITANAALGECLYDQWKPNVSSTVTLTGSDIDAIASLGSNGGVLTGSGVTKPSLQTDATLGKDVIQYDGVSEYLHVPSSSDKYNFLHNGRGGVVMAIVKIEDANPNNAQIIAGNNFAAASTGFALFYDDRSAFSLEDMVRVAIYNGSGVPVVVNTSAADDLETQQYNLIVSVFDGGNTNAASRSLVSVNNGADIDNNSNTAKTTGNNASYNFTVGKSPSAASFYLKGNMAELLVTEGIPSSDKLALFSTYIQQEYGIFPIS